MTIETTYATPWGTVTFTEFVEVSRRYLQAVIARQLTDADDLTRDDILQRTYIAVWKRLQKEPDWLGDDKPKAFVGVIAKHMSLTKARGQMSQSRRETPLEEYTVEGSHVPHVVRGGHSPESRQADVRIDLLAAIRRTAESILDELSDKPQQYALWALYTLTTLDLTSNEARRLFGIRHEAMKRAYDWVRARLQAELPGYAPSAPMRQGLRRRRAELPRERLEDIYAVSAQATAEDYDAVRAKLEAIQPDTLAIDLIVLDAIRAKTSRRQLERTGDLPKSNVDRAYQRIHRMLAAERDPNIRTLIPTKRRAKAFDYKESLNPIIAQVADELLQADQPDLQLIALYGYLCNLPNLKVAREFGKPEHTLRHYRHSIQNRFEELSATLQ